MAITLKPMNIFTAILAALCAACIPAGAQSVYVDTGKGEAGQGLLFSHAGNCYVVMPAHVAGPMGRVGLTSADPVLRGVATALDPFWEGIDLTVGVVRRGIVERCALEQGIFDGRVPARAAEGDLVRVLPSGQLERVRMRITSVRYLDFDAEVVDPGEAVGRGTSGAFLFVDGRPAGMAITSDDESRARFMRIEEIAMNVKRWLGSRGGAFGTSMPQVVAIQPAGFALRLIDAQSPSIAPEFDAAAVLTEDGAYVFEALGRTVLDLGVTGDSAETLRRVRMRSDPAAGHAVPRQVVIEVSTAAQGEGAWRFFWSGEMGPDGLLDTGPRAQTRVRRIRITIAGAWSRGPVRIDHVSME